MTTKPNNQYDLTNQKCEFSSCSATPTEIAVTSSFDSMAPSPRNSFLKVIQNLSSMIFYCLSQSNDPNSGVVVHEISHHFDDYEEITKWSVGSIDSYLWMVVEDGQVDYACLMCGIIYLNRALKSSKYHFHLTNGNWRNVVSSCLLLACKMFDDLGMSNADFRNVFPSSELVRVNSFELTLCLLLEFNLFINEKDYKSYCRRYESVVVTSKSTRRNSNRSLAACAAPPSLASTHDLVANDALFVPSVNHTATHPISTSIHQQGSAFQLYSDKPKSFVRTIQRRFQFLPSLNREKAIDLRKVHIGPT